MKGYIPCAVLAELEARTGKTCHDTFDMFAGTSIGGIVACLLALGRKADEALSFFTDDGPQIFGSEHFLGRGGVFRPRYDADTLEHVLRFRLGTSTLKRLDRALLVPAFDLQNYEPYFFKAPLIEKDYALWQVARATSAAQTYFPAYELDNMVLWDGGNVANNPALCAVAEATRLWPGEKLAILSLGCGPSMSVYKPHDMINAGVVHIGRETMSLLFDANDELPDYILRHTMPGGYFRVAPSYTEALAIDGATPTDLQILKDVAKRCLRSAKPVLDEFLQFTGVVADK